MNLKKFILKSVATTMAISLVYGNVSICGIGISKAIAEDNIPPEIGIELKNEEYVPFHKEKEEVTNKGIAVHSSLEIQPRYEDTNYLPTEKLDLEVSLPQINGSYPEVASVVEAATESTTGKELNTNITQNYNKDSGLLSVSYSDSSNEVNKNEKDKFEIIYIYPAEAYTENEEVALKYTVNATLTLKAESESITAKGNKEISIIAKEDKGTLTEFNTQSKEDIYKGYLYSNVENNTNYETTFNTVSTYTVLNSKLADTARLMLEENKLVLNDKQKTELKTDGNIVYKQTKINKYEFDRMLGQEGKIEIYKGEEVFATVQYIDIDNTKKLAVIYLNGKVDVIENDSQYIIVKYEEIFTDLNIEISKPITEGFLHFENESSIKASKNYGSSVEKINAIRVSSKVNDYTYDTDISLSEPETKMTVTSSNVNFSTLQVNKTTLTVKLDDTNASAKLFNNPIITIKLPEGLTSGNLSSPSLVNENGLKIKKSSTNNNIITIELEGKQSAYDLENVSGGVSIVMDIENLNYKDTLPTHTDKIEVTCKQGKAETKQNIPVNIVSKAGLLMLSKLSNFDNSGSVSSTIEDAKLIEIGSDEPAKEAVHTLDLVNNYNEDLTNVKIIGKVGYSNDELKSTFDTNLSKALSIENAKVYYSTNKDAKFEDESWSEEFTSDAKAFKVELEDNTMSKSSGMEIKEAVQIPEKLGNNQSTYLNLSMSYQYQEKTLEDEVTIGMQTTQDGLTNNSSKAEKEIITSEGENLPVSLEITPYIKQNYVHSGQIVIYKLQVRNNSDKDLTNLVLKDIIPENAIYTYRGFDEEEELKAIQEDVREKEWEIESLKAGEVQEFEIALLMKETDVDSTIENKIQLQYEGQTIEQSSSLALKPAKATVVLSTSIDESYIYDSSMVTFEKDEVVQYRVRVKNITKDSLKNIKVTYEIPKEMEYVTGGLAELGEYRYNITKQGVLNNNTFEYTIANLTPDEEVLLFIECKVKSLQKDYNIQISGIANAEVEQDIYESNTKTIETSQAVYNMTVTPNIPTEQLLAMGDKIVYTINVTNIGNNFGSTDVKYSIPEGIEVEKIEYGKKGEKPSIIETSLKEREINITLDPQEIEEIKITGTVVGKEVEKTTILELTSNIQLIVGEEVILSNELTHKMAIEVVIPDNPSNPDNPNNPDKPDRPSNPDNPSNPGNPTNPENPETNSYTISGTAWVDENKDGKRDEGEKLQDSVIVSLINKETGNFALDQNGNRITTVTDANGNYTFANIPKGNYIVLFEFDTNTYTVTTYQKDGVKENCNSDAIMSNVTIDGQEKLVAITNTMSLDENTSNIDIGLIVNATFDLSIEKLVSKVAVVDKRGTEETTYDNSNVAKVDLVAKYMKGANVIVTYKFVIKNEGEVASFADSLVDNLPSGLEFNSELNPDWYRGNDGSIYTTALAGKTIQPGESITTELVLTKKMTEENTGTFPNSAKLEKISNLQNIVENEKAMENNESSALLIISIKTGSVWLYTGITLVCLGILLVGTYFIKKKVLNRGI